MFPSLQLKQPPTGILWISVIITKQEEQITTVQQHRSQNQTCRDALVFFGWLITSWNWSIHEHGPHLLCSDRHLFWDGRVDGGGVDQQRSLLHLPEESKTNSIKTFYLAKPFCLDIKHLAPVLILFIEVRWGCMNATNVTNRACDRKVCLLEDAIWTCVDFYDVWTGGKHCDDAVCFLCHLCWRVYYLNIGVIVTQYHHGSRTK